MQKGNDDLEKSNHDQCRCTYASLFNPAWIGATGALPRLHRRGAWFDPPSGGVGQQALPICIHTTGLGRKRRVSAGVALAYRQAYGTFRARSRCGALPL